ncbi:hypothetical protein V8F33_010196 [Rhypophila sp. PSN 637]
MDSRSRILAYECEDASVHIPTALIEMKTAEDNFSSIQRAAGAVGSILNSIYETKPRFQTSNLDSLIHDLSTIYSFIRYQIVQQYPTQAHSHPGFLKSRRLASPSSRWPNLEAHSCLCPLTVFLQAVAQSLTNLSMDIAIDANSVNTPAKPPREWGNIRPLWDILVDNTAPELKKTLTDLRLTELMIPRTNPNGTITRDPLIPGVTKCLMLQEEHGTYFVTSSAVRYDRLVGLQELGRATKRNYIDRMRRNFSPET